MGGPCNLLHFKRRHSWHWVLGKNFFFSVPENPEVNGTVSEPWHGRQGRSAGSECSQDTWSGSVCWLRWDRCSASLGLRHPPRSLRDIQHPRKESSLYWVSCDTRTEECLCVHCHKWRSRLSLLAWIWPFHWMQLSLCLSSSGLCNVIPRSSATAHCKESGAGAAFSGHFSL